LTTVARVARAPVLVNSELLELDAKATVTNPAREALWQLSYPPRPVTRHGEAGHLRLDVGLRDTRREQRSQELTFLIIKRFDERLQLHQQPICGNQRAAGRDALVGIPRNLSHYSKRTVARRFGLQIAAPNQRCAVASRWHGGAHRGPRTPSS